MSGEKYSIVLEFAVGSLTLPVLPEKLEVKCAGDNGTAKVLSLGEVSLLRTRKLREITISSVFPAAEAPLGFRPGLPAHGLRTGHPGTERRAKAPADAAGGLRSGPQRRFFH